jgi:hypothetical protein
MKKSIERALNGNLQIVRETLSDGFHVYNVMIGTYDAACGGLDDAVQLFSIIKSNAELFNLYAEKKRG